jgi:hypothetical protein
MIRLFALGCAVMLTLAASTPASLAAPPHSIDFTLRSRAGEKAELRASFRNSAPRGDHDWSTDLPLSALIGLDPPELDGSVTRPIRFAVVREAGRLDCAGSGGFGRGAGSCTFTESAAFSQLLVARGIGRPTRDQAFALMAIDAHAELVEALSAARIPPPSIDNLIALSALGVDGTYVRALAQAGYRPSDPDSLIQFKALGVSAEWIGGLARLGYASLPADELVQLRALGVGAEYITSFERLGYRQLPAETLVQMKALGVTPEFARAAQQAGALPSPQQLIELRATGAQPHRR